MSKIITEIWAENYKCYPSICIPVSAGITVAVGENGNGKSALTTQLVTWVLTNKPDGVKMVRFGETLARAGVRYSDGSEVIREKSIDKKINRYIYTDENGVKETYNGVGTSVPAKISESNKMGLKLISNSKKLLNIVRQSDSLFFLDATPSEKASMVGKTCDTEALDKARQQCSKDIAANTKEIKRLGKEIKINEDNLLDFVSLDNDGKELEKCKTLFNELVNLIKKINKTNSLLSKKNDLLSEKQVYAEKIEKYKNIDLLLSKNDELMELSLKFNKIQINIDKMKHLQEQKYENVQIAEKYKNLPKLFDLYDELDREVRRYNKVTELLEKKKDIISQSEYAKNIITKRNGCGLINLTELEETIKKYDRIDNLAKEKKNVLTRKEKGLEVISRLENERKLADKVYKEALSNYKVCENCVAIDKIVEGVR